MSNSENKAGNSGNKHIVSAAEPVNFSADDEFPLNGDLFRGDGDGPVLLISAATGAPRTFYNKFAAWIVAQGARAALTYDYRGMPGSPKPAEWTARINFRDWALLDFPAAANLLSAHAPSHPMVGIGQSFGGQALGLSGIGNRFDRYAFVATLSGYWGNLSEPLKSYFMMNFVGLPVTMTLGKTAKWMGLGEGIPASVYADWARWCRMPDYFFDDPTLSEIARFADVQTPILSIGMQDDPWGTPKAVNSFVRHYSAADVTQTWVSPSDTGGQSIGHLGFFRSRHSETLWPIAGNWLMHAKPPA